jgi:cytochrome c553
MRRLALISITLILATAGVLSGCSSSGDSSSPDATVAKNGAPGADGNGAPGKPGGTGGEGGNGVKGGPGGPGGPALGPTINATDGAGIFSSGCAGCHGDKGAGGRAPQLAGQKTEEAEVVTTVTNGKGRMPAFKGRLTDAQIKTVAKYVSTL